MMRRVLTAGAGAIAATLLFVPAALARSGGGSSGFGGFGRGGGGGGLGRGFGRGHFFFLPLGGGAAVLVIIVIVIILLYVLPRAQRWWKGQQTSGVAARRRVAERERRVELAAAEAAEDDESFAPDLVRSEAAKLFTDIQAAWDAADRVRLRALVAPDLLAEWERRLDDFERKGWRNRVQPLGAPRIEYVGLTRRGDERGDRVVVRVEATLRDFVQDSYGQHVGRVDSLGETSKVREFWTLGKQPDDSGAADSGEAGGRAGGRREGRWILLSIEQGAEGEHALAEEIVATPWSDERTMRDEALVQGAVDEAVPEGTSIAEVADLDYRGDARAAALDLSLADGRFAPDVLEVAARRAAAAWAEAVDGDDGALLALARPEAAREMLHPGDPSAQTRLVVRGPEIRHITIAALDAAAEPPTMTIDVSFAGRRYVEDRDTAAVVSGSQSRRTTFTERWTLALDGGDEQPWRISAVGAPVAPA